MPPVTAAISDPLKTLLGLFESDADLRDLKFPDVDGSILAEAGRGVLAAAEQVAEAEAALEVARAELQRQQDVLLQKGQRALAYARVFAEEQPELLEKLALVSLPRAPRRASAADAPVMEAEGGQPKRRGRPPKPKGDGPGLFAHETPEPSEVAQMPQTLRPTA